MAWEHLSITRPHLVYLILGGFTSLFMLCSTIIKERMYIGEATVATICGIIFGPYAANLINPGSWGNVDLVTLEFSRIVLVVQCFAIGVELPKYYMERHWKSVIFLLLPVMTYGWLIVSLFIWWLIPPLDWLGSLVVAACVTATDPVLASSVVGKGKFARRVPKHLRDLLSAESGCNDGMAFPFVYLAVYILQAHMDARETVFHWFVYTILYECIFGAIFGFVVGYLARHAIKFSESRDLIDRESFLVFYFVLALFCAGAGSLLGMDDLLIGFAAGVGFSNDGWFYEKTEESHVSNVIDLLINLTYFVYLGTIIPWRQYNDVARGLAAWRLVVLAILVILFRRLPIMMALKQFIPDVKTWREAMFAGHFGPIGVGAIFIAILARAELAYETAVPLSDRPPQDIEHYTLVSLIWPIVTFIVISSIIVHGSSIAVFTLGKRINTLNLTMSYTTSPDEGPSWMSRLPRISSQSKSQSKSQPPPSTSTLQEDLDIPDLPPGTLPPIGLPRHFLRRQVEAEGPEESARTRSQSPWGRRRSRHPDAGPGGPISPSAVFPTHRDGDAAIPTDDGGEPSTPGAASSGRAEIIPREDAVERLSEMTPVSPTPTEPSQHIQVYQEGRGGIFVENEEGDVLALEQVPGHDGDHHDKPEPGLSRWQSLKRGFSNVCTQEREKRRLKDAAERKHKPARAFQFGNTIVIEDEAGEVLKTYELQPPEEKQGPDLIGQCRKYLGIGGPSTRLPRQQESTAESSAAVKRTASRTGWFHGSGDAKNDDGQKEKKKTADGQNTDNKHVRFTIGQTGKRMTERDFILEVQKLDPKTRREVVAQSSASQPVKAIASRDLSELVANSTPSPKLHAAKRPLQEMREGSDGTQNESQDQKETRRKGKQRDTPARPFTGPSADNADNTEETSVERRRREAAIGITTSGDGDGDEEGEEGEASTGSHARREIRFADDLEQGNGHQNGRGAM
ncbi:hypothetical protein SODALDRAFT_341654 [Sodiomyces alkalinus F11]|uniref:Uncharacterized protein n=1 Tax=Sodiomyces alkalinus (strain CBS 110278 / VKM F-3762 / F11) TaxID=1314773 RepID=A0A3N2Q5U4_SODAK|nr:hypothetical protein SODALDRAFT_341654 [Sodiomyces alkalinus F11]ROT42122.1 hypothetical protein SODALDRAFT_341654 [Sodiomyces alkalinus F11]